MLVAVAVGYQLFDECVAFGCRCQHLFADFFAKRVEAAGQSHAFDGFAVAGGKVDTFDKIVDAFVGAVCFAFVDDGFDRTFAHAFDAAEPEAYDAVLIDGARRVGKSYIVEKLAINCYKSYILIDFNKVSNEVKGLFENYLDDLDALTF